MIDVDLCSLIVSMGGLAVSLLLLLKLVGEAQDLDVQCRVPRPD